MAESIRPAGFVLASGRSLRMGATGRLRELGGVAPLRRTVGLIECVLPGSTVIGHLEAYRSLRLHVLADDWPRRRPLGGIRTALRNSKALSSLVVVAICPTS